MSRVMQCIFVGMAIFRISVICIWQLKQKTTAIANERKFIEYLISLVKMGGPVIVVCKILHLLNVLKKVLPSSSFV